MTVVPVKITKTDLTARIENFGETIKDSYPELYDNLIDALADRLFWINEPCTGTIEAPIPAGATHARWVFAGKCLEFRFKNYWTQPLDGDFTEQS